VSLGLVRVDDRLLHGQVAIGWAGALGSKLIVVANDDVAANGWLREIYEEAAPQGIDVRIWTLEEAAAGAAALLGDPETAILLVKDPADLLKLHEMGVEFAEANIGGMHYEEGKRELLPYVYVGDRDVRDMKTLLDSGVDLFAQDVPGGRRHEIRLLLDE
jgi:mannose/fructose/N-acetylgalactosamine-specific phosphotransferase system component IIB